jgi:hypothetical protein
MSRRKGDLRGRAATRQLNRIYDKYEGICQLCFKFCPRNEASREHVVEWCVGGASTDENIVLAHKTCNEGKSRISGMVVKQHELPAEQWWPFMISKEIKACIKRQKTGGPITARIPKRLVNDPEFYGLVSMTPW